MHAQNAHQNHHVPGSSGTCAGLCAGFFGKKPNEINDVPDVPAKTPTFLMRAHAHASAKTATHFLPPHGYIPRHIRHIRHILVFKRKNGKKPGTQPGTTFQNPAHHPFLVKTPRPMATRTIQTTPDNAKQVQQLVKADPQLHALVQSLQAQGMFPGLRAVTFHLAGTPEHCAQGLASWGQSINPTKSEESV